MKKILFALMCLFMFSSVVYGAGSSFTVISDKEYPGGERRIITCLAVADDSDGSIPELTLKNSTTGIGKSLVGWTFFRVTTFGDHAVTHDGTANATALSDGSGGFNLLEQKATNGTVSNTGLVGYTLTNTTDSSSGTITTNTDSTITATLSGGTDDDWDVGDVGLWGVEPTTNSEIYIFMNGVDILGGNGVNAVDNDANNSIPAYVNSLPAAITITNDLVINITQQAAATNSAIIPIQIELYR